MQRRRPRSPSVRTTVVRGLFASVKRVFARQGVPSNVATRSSTGRRRATLMNSIVLHQPSAVASTAMLLVVFCSLSAAARPMAERGPSHWVDRSGDLPREPLTALALDPENPRIVWVGVDGFVYRSENDGESFVAVLSFPRGIADDTGDIVGGLNGRGAAVVDPTTADGVGVDMVDRFGDGDDDNGDLPDGSAFASDQYDPLDSVDFAVPARVEAGVRTFAFVPGSRGVVLVATPRGLWRTLDSGGSFQRLELPGGSRGNDIRDVAVDPRVPSRLFVATAGGLFFSSDGGGSFVRGPGRTATVPGVCFDVSVVDGATQVVYGTELGLLRSKDSGATFADLLLQGAGAFPVVHAVDSQPRGPDRHELVYAATSGGLFVAERGAPILERYSGIPAEAATAVVVDPEESGGVLVAYRTGGRSVLFSDDAGLTLVDVAPPPVTTAQAAARSAAEPSRVWIAGDQGLFRLEPGTGVTLSTDDARSLREQFRKEPSLDHLTLLALARRGLSPTDDQPMERSFWAGAFPRVDARYQLDAGTTDVVRQTFLFRDASALAPFLDPALDETALFGNGLFVQSPERRFVNTVWVVLTWDLDRIGMNRSAVTAARQIPVRATATRDVIDRVHSLFVQRRRLVAELHIAPRRQNEAEKRERIHKVLRLLEIEAQITALVGDDPFAFEPG